MKVNVDKNLHPSLPTHSEFSSGFPNSYFQNIALIHHKRSYNHGEKWTSKHAKL